MSLQPSSGSTGSRAPGHPRGRVMLDSETTTSLKLDSRHVQLIYIYIYILYIYIYFIYAVCCDTATLESLFCVVRSTGPNSAENSANCEDSLSQEAGSSAVVRVGVITTGHTGQEAWQESKGSI